MCWWWLRKRALAFEISHLLGRRKQRFLLNDEGAAVPIPSEGFSEDASSSARDFVQLEMTALPLPSPSPSPPAWMHYCPFYTSSLQLRSKMAINANYPKDSNQRPASARIQGQRSIILLPFLFNGEHGCQC